MAMSDMKDLLEKMGIYYIGNELKPFNYSSDVTGTHLKITNEMNLIDIVEMIFNEGVKEGVEIGKEKRSQEFKDLLNI